MNFHTFILQSHVYLFPLFDFLSFFLVCAIFYYLQNSVTEKLETLIVEMMPLRFVAQARMSQSLGQQKRISEFVSDSLF